MFFCVCFGCGAVQLIASGSCTVTVTWTLDAKGVLTITGFGELVFQMPGAAAVRAAEPDPWAAYASQIKSVVVSEGITEIGEATFQDLPNLETVIVAGSVETVGASAFANCERLTVVTFQGSAPVFEEKCFENVNATIVHPETEETWTEEVLENAGGDVELSTKVPEKSKALLGDVDGNCKLTYNDALIILRASIKLHTLTDDQSAIADFDGNGKLDYNDALKVLRASIGLK